MGDDTDRRQPVLTPDDLTQEQQTLYDAIAGGPRASGPFALVDSRGVLQGPFGGFLLAPAVGDCMQRLGAAIRYESGLTDRVRELAILVVAGRFASPFERYAHEAVGRRVGLSDAEMAAACRGDLDRFETPDEQAALKMTCAIVDGEVSDEVWRQCVPPLTSTSVFELIVLVGYYSMLAVQMRVLRTEEVVSAAP